MQNKFLKPVIISFLVILSIFSIRSSINLTQSNSKTEPFKNSETFHIHSPIAGNTHPPISIDGNNWSIYCEASGLGTFENPYMISDLIIDGNGSDGIFINSSTAYGIIKNCTVLNSMTGIKIWNSKNIKVENTLINDSKEHCIWTFFSENCVFSYNILENGPHGGMWISNSKFITISNSNVSNNLNYGIGIGTSIYCTISNNYISNNPYCGILLSGTNHIIQDNVIYNNRERGIIVCDSDHLIQRNMISLSDYGIYFGDSSDVNLVDNIFHNISLNEFYFSQEFYDRNGYDTTWTTPTSTTYTTSTSDPQNPISENSDGESSTSSSQTNLDSNSSGTSIISENTVIFIVLGSIGLLIFISLFARIIVKNNKPGPKNNYPGTIDKNNLEEFLEKLDNSFQEWKTNEGEKKFKN
ncbi:right-handed parallel beta-helix repeat-containing protein [Candidatus Lokiarchaeum ossiferum]